MFPGIDLQRAADLLIRRHGAAAELEAGRLTNLMRERGDRDGQLVWIWIRRAVVDLQASGR